MDISTFLKRQYDNWPQLAATTRGLAKVKTRRLKSIGYTLQYNPGRRTSSATRIDEASLAARGCLLCPDRRPPEQLSLPWRDYQILVNPYPIFAGHLTIVADHHTPQRIYDGFRCRVADMAALAADLSDSDYAVFYNGPRCGASCPDHMHLQAVPAACLPLLAQIKCPPVGEIDIFEYHGINGLVAAYADADQAVDLFGRICRALPADDDREGCAEPRLNIICEPGMLVVVPRRAHRPSCYGTDPGQYLISPGAIDVTGVMVVPRDVDYKSLTTAKVSEIIDEVCIDRVEAENILAHVYNRVNVGIMRSDHIEMTLSGDYRCGDDIVTGAVSISARQCRMPISFVPLSDDCLCRVEDVTIGVDFHWQRNRSLSYRGTIRLFPDEDSLQLVNTVDIETYIASVIASEMSGTSSVELLKAHAVISRSWLLAQMRAGRRHPAITDTETDMSQPGDMTQIERIVWYDHDNHSRFDVCADDHCQRYQGVGESTPEAVVEAVTTTAGQVLVCNGELCDTRFAKCCGGAFEDFRYCWADDPKTYLRAGRDYTDRDDVPDLTDEATARRWIMSAPKAYCNTRDIATLTQVLNDYDRETTDFYRWSVDIDSDRLAQLILAKSGIDVGAVVDLVPLRRGVSGRIYLLRIVGSRCVLEVGKELEIRRLLAETHLYSSAFVVDRIDGGFRLHGAGWGHGVGLCQIGAAVMASEGVDYRRILSHYYPDSVITDI